MIVGFPLRGEWSATTTPAHKVPSHGTNLFAQTYAYDFARLGRSQYDFCRVPFGVYFVLGAPTRSSYSFGEPVYSVADGRVIAARDGIRDRRWLHPLPDLFIRKFRLLRRFRRGENVPVEELLGNFVIIQVSEGVFAAYAHLKGRSLRVGVGADVVEGQQIGEVGTTGNANGPHLHFQLMNAPRLEDASGVPCHFRSFEVLDERNGWQPRSGAMPELHQKVRVTE
jgi:hypothetical protein